MKYYIFIFVMICCPALLLAQKTFYTDEDFSIVVKKKQAEWKVVTVPVPGDAQKWKVMVYRPKSKKGSYPVCITTAKNQMAFKNTWDGKVFWYFSNSDRLKTEGEFRNGKEHGSWTSYFYSGETEEEGSFKNGNKQGVWLEYYENGELFRRSSYDKEGKLTGIRAIFTDEDDSTVRIYSTFENGLKNGVEINYNRDNIIKSRSHYLNDSLDGSYEYFYPDGKKKGIQHYKDNGLIDTSVFYFEDGKIACREIFKSKNNLSVFYWFDASGKVTKTGTDYFESYNVNSPLFNRAEDTFALYIRSNFKYPAEAQDNGISAYIQTYFTVNNNGEIHIDKIKVRPATAAEKYGFEKEVKRLLNNFDGFPHLNLHNLDDKTNIVLPIVLNLN